MERGRDRAGPGGREVGRGVTGPAGKEEKGSWAGLLLGFGLVGVSSSFSFLIQTNLTQMNPNLNLNSLKHSNKLNQCSSMMQQPSLNL